MVAADDGIKPQTVEAIKHAQAAKVPIIVAINKCDLPEKNISKIKNEMMKYELIAEDLSGDTLFVEVSALKKINLDKLKESILLQSEILDLKASYDDNLLVFPGHGYSKPNTTIGEEKRTGLLGITKAQWMSGRKKKVVDKINVYRKK